MGVAVWSICGCLLGRVVGGNLVWLFADCCGGHSGFLWRLFALRSRFGCFAVL